MKRFVPYLVLALLLLAAAANATIVWGCGADPTVIWGS